MRKPVVSRTSLILLPVAALAVGVLASVWMGADFDRALGIGGIVYGVATLALAELRTRDGPTKSVVVVGIDDAAYMANLVDGLRAELTGSLPYELTLAIPQAIVTSPEEWQVQQLGGAAAMDADAVVVVPADDDTALWNALARHQRRGATVIAVDRRPRRTLFLGAGLQPPPYVASDFVKGGRLAGEAIAERLEASPGAVAVVALGPGESGPGTARSAQVLYALARRGLSARVIASELSTWDLAAAKATLLAAIEGALLDPHARAVAFCGDDRILVALQGECVRRQGWIGRVELVGYDGARSVDGRLVVFEHDLAIATVDTQPLAQGRVVGQILQEAYRREASQDAEQRLVNPVLVRADSV